MDPQTIERAIKRCIDISVRLGALEDDVPPAAGWDATPGPAAELVRMRKAAFGRAKTSPIGAPVSILEPLA